MYIIAPGHGYLVLMRRSLPVSGDWVDGQLRGMGEVGLGIIREEGEEWVCSRQTEQWLLASSGRAGGTAGSLNGTTRALAPLLKTEGGAPSWLSCPVLLEVQLPQDFPRAHHPARLDDARPPSLSLTCLNWSDGWLMGRDDRDYSGGRSAQKSQRWDSHDDPCLGQWPNGCLFLEFPSGPCRDAITLMRDLMHGSCRRSCLEATKKKEKGPWDRQIGDRLRWMEDGIALGKLGGPMARPPYSSKQAMSHWGIPPSERLSDHFQPMAGTAELAPV
ncbi:hypothetical protein QBC43DRAFT_103919 [Cladorrhinum sp. PSN259]|nr:hypothetical protein QBC43DRAFT_103919 [Cladorrhinum sp. PSN259]